MSYDFEQSIFPDFPRTKHLPAFGSYRPNASKDDVIADASALLLVAPRTPSVDRWAYVEEKIDGANSGVMYCPSLESEIGQPFMLRNRNHILRKGYSAKTKGKQQFVPFWNWYYQHVDQFVELNKMVSFEAVVYGEWLWPKNPCTIVYDFDKVPNNFIAYDIWDWQNKRFYPNPRSVLESAGFTLPPLLVERINRLDDLLPLLEQNSIWSAEADKQLEPCQCKREGLYIKVVEGDKIAHRFKMVRPDYKPGMFFEE